MSKHITRYAVAAALLAACYQDDASVAAPQAVRPQITVRLTDAPFPYDSLHSVNIYVVRIEANTAADTSGGGRWALITEPRKTFDLLALQQGATTVLGQGEMPAGEYHAVRMTIDTVRSSITWNDAAQHAAHVNWHGWTTIYAFVEYPVEVAAQGADIVLDFDIGRSFLFNYYGNYEFDFTPQLRAINSAAAGAIAGTVTQGSGTTTSAVPNAQVSVFVPNPGQPDSIAYLEATGRSDSAGRYKVGFLPPGTYIVRIEEPFLPYLEPVVTPNVQVGARDTTRLSVALPSAGSSGAYLRISGSTSVGVGGSITLFAAVGDAQGNLVSNPAVSWTSGDRSIAEVFGVGDTATVLGHQPGLATIVAACDASVVGTPCGSLRDSVTIQVSGTPSAVAAVEVRPASATLAVGDTMRFDATLRDSAGNILTGHAVSWFPSDSAFAIINNFGTSIIGRGMRVGSALLQATSEGKTGQATITVH
ncbi:MAG TPA: DUF4382 domain-containing protein [Gemmatimonadales bacterium]|jgi:hypothetical protein